MSKINVKKISLSDSDTEGVSPVGKPPGGKKNDDSSLSITTSDSDDEKVTKPKPQEKNPATAAQQDSLPPPAPSPAAGTAQPAAVAIPTNRVMRPSSDESSSESDGVPHNKAASNPGPTVAQGLSAMLSSKINDNQAVEEREKTTAIKRISFQQDKDSDSSLDDSLLADSNRKEKEEEKKDDTAPAVMEKDPPIPLENAPTGDIPPPKNSADSVKKFLIDDDDDDEPIKKDNTNAKQDSDSSDDESLLEILHTKKKESIDDTGKEEVNQTVESDVIEEKVNTASENDAARKSPSVEVHQDANKGVNNNISNTITFNRVAPNAESSSALQWTKKWFPEGAADNNADDKNSRSPEPSPEPVPTATAKDKGRVPLSDKRILSPPTAKEEDRNNANSSKTPYHLPPLSVNTTKHISTAAAAVGSDSAKAKVLQPVSLLPPTLVVEDEEERGENGEGKAVYMTTKQALQRILEQRITICPDAAEDSETLLFLSGGGHDATDATTEETYLSTRLLQPTFTGANSNVNSVAGLLTSPRRGGSTNKREDSYQNASPSPARGSGRYLSNNNVKSFDSVLDCPQPIIRPYSYTSDTGAEVDLYYAGARRRSSVNTVFNNHAMRKSSNAISLPMESAVHNSTNSSNKSVDADGNSLWSRVPLKQER